MENVIMKLVHLANFQDETDFVAPMCFLRCDVLLIFLFFLFKLSMFFPERRVSSTGNLLEMQI